MEFVLSGDSWWEAKIDKVFDAIWETGYMEFISTQDYGTSIKGITVVLNCVDPLLNFKQRIRFAKKEKILYLDIMLDLEQFIVISQKERDIIVAKKLISEIPIILGKYKFTDFNLQQFELDLKRWIGKIYKKSNL